MRRFAHCPGLKCIESICGRVEGGARAWRVFTPIQLDACEFAPAIIEVPSSRQTKTPLVSTEMLDKRDRQLRGDRRLSGFREACSGQASKDCCGCVR